MTLFVYTVMDPECPETCRFACGNLPDGAKNPNWLCTGATPSEARDKMERFLNPPPKVKDIKQAVIVPGEPEPDMAVSTEDEGEVL